MTKQTEALKMAHKTFMQLNERHPRRDNGNGCFDKELKTINEALEQPAQEPVSLGDFDNMTKAECVDYIEYLRKEIDLLRFKEWQGLSDDEIKAFGKDFFDIDICLTGNLMNFARAIEQALKEKNT